jgi:signal transduction histidine kinase
MLERLKKAEQDRSAGLRRFASSMQRAQEEERARLSRELHDDLCQRLTGMKYRVEVLEDETVSDEHTVGEQLRDVREELDRSIAEVRRISSNLRPSVLDDFGLVTALRLLVKEFEKRTEIPVQVHCADDFPDDLHGDTEIALYRIAQEAPANITKHAQASAVEVRLSGQGDTVELSIRDNGRGIAAGDAPLKRAAGHGLGLLGMRERAELLGGDFEVDTEEGQGTAVTARLPVAREE